MLTQTNPHREKSAPGKPSPFWDRFVYVVLGAILLAIVVIVGIAFVPADAVSGAQPQAPQPANPAPAQPVAVVSDIALTTSQTASSDGGDGGFEPPVVDQGGTCIQGFIIDSYEQRRGGMCQGF